MVLGHDSIDFDVALTDLSPSAQTATVAVRHIPPANRHQIGSRLDALTGGRTVPITGCKSQEMLGKLVVARKRECADLPLTACGDPVSHQIRQQGEIIFEH